MTIISKLTQEQRLKRKSEMLINGEVFRRNNQYPNYYVSDKGTVLSLVGKGRVLKQSKSGQVCVTDFNGESVRISSTRLCVKAFEVRFNSK